MICFNCKTNYDDLKTLVDHLKKCYTFKEGSKEFTLKCTTDTCNKTFRSFKSFIFHVKGHTVEINHKYLKTNNSENWQTSVPPSKPSFDVSQNFDQLKFDFESEVENLITYMSVSLIPNVHQDEIMKYVENLLNICHDSAKSNIKDEPEIPLEMVDLTFMHVKYTIKAHKTKFLRNKNLASLPFYTAPSEKSLSVRIETVESSSSNSQVEKATQSTFQYVPLLENLKKMFKCNNFKNKFFEKKNHICGTGVYYDICCGSNVRDNKFFKENENAIMIELYYDEVEPCDGLKSSRGNVDLNEILRHIRAELQVLEEQGIEVKDHGFIKGTLVCTVHDNLAAHMMLCMTLGFNSKYFCRFCKITLEDSLQTVESDPSLWRVNTREIIENSMTEDQVIADPHVTFGFKKVSQLSYLKHFNIETGTTVDPFHDLLEGIVPRDLNLVFHFMMKVMKISEEEIKNFINAFHYGRLNNKHKPSNVTFGSNRLGLSGMQCLTLILNFHFIFGHYFKTPEQLKILNFTQNLTKITCIAFKNILTESDRLVLHESITHYLTELKVLFPHARYSRKHHFLIHYPEVIERLGPTAHMSTAPHEMKHVFFTSFVRKIGINKNIVKTLTIMTGSWNRFHVSVQTLDCQIRRPVQDDSTNNHDQIIKTIVLCLFTMSMAKKTQISDLSTQN
uniref:CSON005766 protein n=1 Tax=Culicoides sonorensis TaxID=179676 RepID=A0A336MTF2_CULSO